MALTRTDECSGCQTLMALTTVEGLRPVLPHNSIWGLHFYAMGTTRTQASTLLVLLVLMKLALRPQVRVYMLG